MMRSEDQAIDLLRRLFGTETVVGVADSEANEGDCVRECTDPDKADCRYQATGDEQHRPAGQRDRQQGQRLLQERRTRSRHAVSLPITDGSANHSEATRPSRPRATAR